MRETLESQRRGRPRGQQHDAMVHVRLPRAVVTLLKQLAAREGLRLAQLIRACIEDKLVKAAQTCADMARDPSRSPRTQLKALELHRLCMIAGLYLSPTGLTIARAEAAGLADGLFTDASITSG